MYCIFVCIVIIDYEGAQRLLRQLVLYYMCVLFYYFSMLFSAIMKGLERFYTTGDIVPTSCGRLPTSKMAHVSKYRKMFICLLIQNLFL